MPVTITDRSREADARYDDAAQKGLAAAANLLVRELKKAHGSNYYKGGAFRDTVKVKASIRALTPYKDATGMWETQVGTNKIIALYWELGHHNLFTGNPERVEIWHPTGAAQAEPMKAAFARVVARLMGTK